MLRYLYTFYCGPGVRCYQSDKPPTHKECEDDELMVVVWDSERNTFKEFDVNCILTEVEIRT